MAYTLTPSLVHGMLQRYPELEKTIHALTQRLGRPAAHSGFWTISERARNAVMMGTALKNAGSIEKAKELGLQWGVWEQNRLDQRAEQESAEGRPQQAHNITEPRVM